MKYLPIILATVLTMGTLAIAQDSNPTPPPARPDRGTEVQRGPGGPGFRGGPEMEKIRKEMDACPVCQEYKKHMKEKHPGAMMGPGMGRGRGMGPRGPQQPPPDAPKDR